MTFIQTVVKPLMKSVELRIRALKASLFEAHIASATRRETIRAADSASKPCFNTWNQAT